MKTPIVDFVTNYKNLNGIRFHMPGHKGQTMLGCEISDITEVSGADALYEASGIIAESEEIATTLFGTRRTLFSTEGSSQCVRAMLELARGWWQERQKEQKNPTFSNSLEKKIEQRQENKIQEVSHRPVVIATRNVHKSFLYAAILLDFDIVWLWPEKEDDSLCSCSISVEQLEHTLQKQKEASCCEKQQNNSLLEEELQEQIQPVAAVYITSPNYLGGEADIKAIAEICHKYNTLLLVDNAHGAYLRFLTPSNHPIVLGADLCCDSAHKTLPVLTGGAYLHISENAPKGLETKAKQAMELFGSTSPSYLILQSLDLCNAYLTDGYREKLSHTILRVEHTKQKLKEYGFDVLTTDPLRITIKSSFVMSGQELANVLRMHHIECEYADNDYVVLMVTPENKEEDFKRFEEVMRCIAEEFVCKVSKENVTNQKEREVLQKKVPIVTYAKQVCSVREAFFSLGEVIPVQKAFGRICRMPTATCPPAIPIVVPGEQIDETAIRCFMYYGIEQIDVVKNE